VTAFVVLIFLVFHFTGTGSTGTEEAQEVVTSVPKVSIDDSFLSEYLQEAQIENGTLRGVILPKWNELLEDYKKNLLQQMLSVGGQKGFEKVHLVDISNKTVATAAPNDIRLMK